MRKIKRKLTAIGMCLAFMAASASSLTASAATWESWRPFYAPYTGSFYADADRVQVSGLKWNTSQITTMVQTFPCNAISWHGLEFEFRPHIDPDGYTRPVNKNVIWGVTSTTYSNLPNSYFENQPSDPDDVSLGCKKVNALVAGTSYYSQMNFRTGAGSPYIGDYTFEVEVGQWIPVASNVVDDYFPIRYSPYLSAENNVWFATNYSW